MTSIGAVTRGLGVVAGMAMLGMVAAAPAHAAAELITNGNFEDVTLNNSAYGSSYQLNNDSNSNFTGVKLRGWGNTGYGFLYTPGSADTTGAYSSQYGNTLNLWGPGGGTSSPNYSNNGLTATSPVGGNYVALDGDFGQGFLYQTLNNLVVGQLYNLSFWWAAAQQVGYTGATTEGFTVYWADASRNATATYKTQTVNTASKGFTPWMQVTTSFVATTTTNTLAFIASGGPSGSPPFSLLDGVSLVAAPEPATWTVMVVGLVALAGYTTMRRRQRPGSLAA